MTVNSLKTDFTLTDTEVYIPVLAHTDENDCFKIKPLWYRTNYKEEEPVIFVSEADYMSC